MSKPFLSVCILAYNRPDKLYRLLKTIDARDSKEVEVVISDDLSPRREEIRSTIERFKKEARYSVVYHENPKNLGFDGNLKETVRAASGTWLVFMGDDDEFIAGKLDALISFLREHKDLGYVLRSYEIVHNNGKTESFRYYAGNIFFKPGEKTYEELFRKSVFISGVTIKREPILPYLVDDFDGTALTQIYWVAELLLKHAAAYFDEPIVRHVKDKRYKAKEVMYGEAGKLVRRRADVQHSLDFLGGYTKIAQFMDNKYGFHSARNIMLDLSKYSYPSLSIHRDEGLAVFFSYVSGLNKLGFNISVYYYVYVFFLTVFGRKFCDFGIRMIKNILGRTPRL